MRNECNNPCFDNNKLIPSKNQCIERCSTDGEYSYEFNNICYEQRPEHTHTLNENEFICQEELDCGEFYYN